MKKVSAGWQTILSHFKETQNVMFLKQKCTFNTLSFLAYHIHALHVKNFSFFFLIYVLSLFIFLL